MVAEPAPKPKSRNTPMAVFLSRSGYIDEDIISYNLKTLVFATSNGGKYQLTKKGAIRRIHGPWYPKYVEPEV